MENKEYKIKSFRELAMPKFLYGGDLLGKQWTATIAGYSQVEVYSKRERQNEIKGVIEFVEPNIMPVIMNKRKSQQLDEIFPDASYAPEKAIGRKLVIFTVDEKHFGVTGSVIHFKAFVSPKLPSLSPKGTKKKWDGAMKSLKEKTVTIAQILKVYSVTEANLVLLKAAVPKKGKD